MTADFSRIRMNPLAAFAGVELQQGRVLLDADFNEQVAVVDRRLRALASDVLGRATVSQTTTDAFHLTPAGAGFTIGRGRMYVDGLLAENFGRAVAAERIFDPLLAETVYSQDPSYAEQPWLQPPPALPTGGIHLVYLDVWERELTAVEMPALVEPALGGPDTSARLQTVWQVRVLGEQAPESLTCTSPDADIPGWMDLIAPSTGRMTTGTFDVSAVPDPCELPPTGGYTGLENQLYRVEVHDAGALGGGATFKWSRDNASVATRVATIVSASELELDSLGRDEVLRFAVGHWVEITDDRREFAQLPGEMRKIDEVDEASRRIRFTPDLPADLLPASLPDSVQAEALNLRVRRWDQAGEIVRTAANGTVVVVQDLDAAGSTGVIDIPAAGTTLLLENGVTVSFSSVGTKGFRSGDAWVFAARTADASVEALDQAAPRSVHHHYARLGFWNIGAGTISDCRGKWPPAAGGDDCSCTACVTEASHASGSFTIQDAVNQVREAGGGTVCIGIGSFTLEAPVEVTSTISLRIRGQGMGTVILARGTAFDIRVAIAMAMEDLTIVAVGSDSAIVVSTALGFALRRLAVAVVGGGDFVGAAVALAGAILAARIEDNLLLAPVGVRALEPSAEGSSQILLSADLAIENNLLWCERSAVLFEGPVLHLLETRVAGNQALSCSETALALLGYAAPGSSVRLVANQVQTTGGGISCSLDGLWIEDNKLGASGETAGVVGIELRPGLDKDGADQCQILANQISGYGEAGIVIRAQLRSLIIKLNIIENCGNGIVMEDDAQAESAAIENNQLRDIGPSAGDAKEPIVGILLSRVDGATIGGNTLRRIGASAEDVPLRAAAVAFATQRLRVDGNEIVEFSPSGDYGGLAIGIFVTGPFLKLDVQRNHIDRELTPLAEPGRSTWAALIAATATVSVETTPSVLGPIRFGAYAAVPFEGGATLVINHTKAYVAPSAGGDGASVAVLGNAITGRSLSHSVAVVAGRECLFSDNRCEHLSASGPAVSLTTPVAIMNGNRVRNNNDISISIEGTSKAVAAVANITTGIIQAPGMGSQFNALNLRG